MSNPRYNRVLAPVEPDVILPEQKIKYFPAAISLGGFILNTNPTGALEAKPAAAPDLTPAVSVSQPVSLVSDISGLQVVSSAEFGGRVSLSDLLNKLLDIPISVAGVEMPLRSLFGSILTRLAAEEAATADISGVRIPAIVTEQLGNAALDAAREAAQALKDAAQDASGVLLQLAAASAASDIAAVAGRVTVLEAAPAFDATTINGRLDAAEGAIALKAAQADVDAALLLKANQAEFTVVADRVTAVETGAAGASSRLDALEAAVPSKVAQADYDVYVAATDAAIAGKADASAVAAKADTTYVDAGLAAKEDMGRIHKIDIVTTDVSGVNGAYWMGSLDGVIGAIVTAGKVAEFIADGSNTISHFVSAADADGQVAGKTYRFKNGSAAALWTPVLGSQGGVVVEVQPGETVTVVADGAGGWKML